MLAPHVTTREPRVLSDSYISPNGWMKLTFSNSPIPQNPMRHRMLSDSYISPTTTITSPHFEA